ncbi:MAG: glycoside hydrolase family 65 protein, partial [Microlunatus sp.]|nr:glycoside hydrolase family 65 protein [Microlunatus sp.]
DAPVVISSQTLNRQDGRDEYHVRAAAMGAGVDPRKAESFEDRVLDPQLHNTIGDRILLGYRCHNSKMTLAVGVDHQIETDNYYTQDIKSDSDTGEMVYRIDAEAGKTITVTKIVSYHSSRGVPVRELADRCRRTLDRAERQGIAQQRADQRHWLDAFWARSDVEITGQPEVQQAVRWNLFQLVQATGRSEQSGVAAKGVTGSGYSGHYFWDTEIYTLPFLTYTSPWMAHSALRFRYNLLGAARGRAEAMTQDGALFPWRTISGEEASAFYAAGTAQYHIDADISYALMKYVNATGDDDFMWREGVDILVETARLWADLGFWRERSDYDGSARTFHIHGVTGPDEYTTVVNDNLFTNVMARFNLAKAAEVVRRLAAHDGPTFDRLVDRLQLAPHEVDDWEAAAEAMSIPYDHATGIHPQDSHFLDREVWDLKATPANRRPLLLHYHPLVIYRFQVIKQADVVLALFLQGDHFTLEEKRADFDYYDPITTGDSTLSGVVQSIIAAEVGYRNLALRYFYSSLFVDLVDLHGNTSDGVHVASTGGVWNMLAYGFAGMRDYDGTITFDPRLPSGWEALTFRITLQGTRVRVRVQHGSIEFEVEKGESATVTVRDRAYAVSADAPVTVPITGQGPTIDGEPTLHSGDRRQDGTLIIATVPHARVQR